MQIPRRYLQTYSDALNAVSDKARAQVLDALSRIDYNADVATIREAVISIMERICGASSEVAARLASEFYNGLRSQFGIDDGFSATPESGRSPEATAEGVHAIAGELVDGNPECFVRKCADRADTEARRAANECIAKNARRDPKKPGWARVPVGSETCSFCLMLASRGFVYKSEDTASHAHPNCDCRVVPSWDKENPAIEGYDPAYYGYVLAGKEDFTIPASKITDYCLSDENKSKAFREYLGFERGRDEGMLTEKLYAAAAKEDLIPRGANDYGDLYYQNTIIEGRNGKTARVRMAWIKPFGDDKMRLTTAFVDE